MLATLKRKTRLPHQRYQVDLLAQQKLSERNYARFMQLPFFYTLSETQHAQGSYDWFNLQFVILEQSLYTTLLSVKRPLKAMPLIHDVRLRVRLYHDVQLAEVVQADHQPSLQGKYDYPNRNMYQPDEKYQINQFLSDLLEYRPNG